MRTENREPRTRHMTSVAAPACKKTISRSVLYNARLPSNRCEWLRAKVTVLTYSHVSRNLCLSSTQRPVKFTKEKIHDTCEPHKDDPSRNCRSAVPRCNLLGTETSANY